MELTRVRGGYRVKTQGGVHLEVRPLLRMFRLAEVPEHETRETWRYWCFTTFEAAVLAAAAWDVDEGSEPVGWVRRGGART